MYISSSFSTSLYYIFLSLLSLSLSLSLSLFLSLYLPAEVARRMALAFAATGLDLPVFSARLLHTERARVMVRTSNQPQLVL